MNRPSLIQKLAVKLGTLYGWRIQNEAPLPQRCVIIGAPHTSNYDFFALLLYVFGTNTRLHWVGKHTLFAKPFGALMRALGGIPVNRSKASAGFVDRMIEIFEQEPVFRLAIAPEGTRKRAAQWKTGFYHIAVGASVPLVLGFVDYQRKVVGQGPTLIPTGDIEADFQLIEEFYADHQGKHPENQGPVVQPETADQASGTE